MLDVKAMLVLLLLLMASVGCVQAQDASQALKQVPVTVPATRLGEITPRSGIGFEYSGRPGELQVPVSSLPIAIGVPQHAIGAKTESETSLDILFESLAPVTPIDLSHIRDNIPRSLESLRDFTPLPQLQPK